MSVHEFLLNVKPKIYIIIYVIFFLNLGVADAVSYYIAPGGNNSNTGLSTDQAWSNLSWAVNNSGKVIPGTTIFLLNGTYYDTASIIFDTNNDGNATHPVIITAYNGTPIIDGIDSSSSSFGFIIGTDGAYSTGYITISNITIRNFKQQMQVRYAQNIIIRNTTQYNSDVPSAYGILAVMDGSRDIILDGNILHDKVGYNSLLVKGNIDSLHFPVYNVSVINNEVWGNDKHWAIQVEGNVSNITVANNYVHDNPYRGGIDIYQGAENRRVQNFLYSNNIINSGKMYVSYATDGIIENTTITDGYLDLYGNSLPANNFTLQNITFRNITTKDYSGFNSIEGGKNLLFDRINTSNFSVEYQWQIRNTQGNITFRDLVNPINGFYLRLVSSAVIEYSDNSVFDFSQGSVSGSVNLTTLPRYYVDKSNFSQDTIGTNTSKFTIKKYPMTARPTSAPATITVNKFDTSLPQGQVMIDLTVNTAKSNSIEFTADDLSVDESYIVKKGGISIPSSRDEGRLVFNNSIASGNSTFTVEKGPKPTGIISGIIKYINQTLLAGATVTLYNQDGSPYGKTAVSGADGKFQINNITAGSYYVNITKGKNYGYNTSAVVSVASSTVNLGSLSLMYYDINGDGEINVLDLSEIVEHNGSAPARPIYDVNGDGRVDTRDIDAVREHFDIIES